MLSTKLFRVLDRATEMAVVAVSLRVDQFKQTGAEILILGRAGFGPEFPIILVSKIGAESNKACWDWRQWNDRTVTAAHRYIEAHWENLRSGDTLDVRDILGEREGQEL